MHYREFGKYGKVSLLSMGVMRLPQLQSFSGGYYVDREKAYELLRYAVDNGINYFDTAFGYHAETAEEILGEALYGERRKKVMIGTKQPLYAMKTHGHIRRNLENTLRKLRTDYLDFYMIHAIGPGTTWDAILNQKIIEEFDKFKSEGLIRGVAFSYHGNLPHFKEVINHYDWDLCTVLQNFLDTDREVTDQVYDFMKQHSDTALVIMEPLRGGALAGGPKKVYDIYDTYPKKRTPAEWAFRYLIDKPEISTILSGMSSLEQLKENIEIFSKPDAIPGCFTDDERKILAQVRDAYNSIVTIPCTTCGYCVPCPANVNIPGIFTFYNDGMRFEYFDSRRRSYMFMTNDGKDFTKCTGCGVCNTKCPQAFDVLGQLKVAHEALKGWVELPGQ